MAASPRLDREARDRPRLRRGPAAFQLLFVFVCIGLCYAPASQAQQRFDIRSAYVERAEGVYQLTATLDFDIGEGARAAVRDGAPFTLHLEIVVRRQRSYWLDEGVAALEQSYELVYHALSDRYLVRNVNSGEQASYATLDAALDSLRVISNLPILDQALVRPERRHEISLRASLDVRTMPDTLRFILFWSDDWRQRSEWYTWSPRL
ncbi:MAG TPA: DUF4390 domain-containing protein [Steroidobacteraceae bacterium]|nr:DUF4390 domain-containing protein [Steroidobacteraceae bacterium]